MTEQTTTRRPRKMAREPHTEQQCPAAPTVKSVTPKPQTKASLVEALLLKDGGASLDDLCQETSWLPHTCRAFLTGLRKKGRAFERNRREDGATIYQLAPIEAAV